MFNGKDFSFISDKTVKARIKQGDLVNGLTVDEESNVALDKTFAHCLMGKSGLGFEPIMSEDEDEPVMNKYYKLIRSGVLPSRTVGRRKVVPVAAVANYLVRGEKKP